MLPWRHYTSRRPMSVVTTAWLLVGSDQRDFSGDFRLWVDHSDNRDSVVRRVVDERLRVPGH